MDGPGAVAKNQKHVALDEDLLALVTAYQERVGDISFTRILNAALLHFFFDGFDDPDPNQEFGPDPEWLRVAWRVDRGDVSIEDLPRWLIERYIEFHSQASAPEGKEKISRAKAALVMLDKRQRKGKGKKDFLSVLLRERYPLAHPAIDTIE